MSTTPLTRRSFLARALGAAAAAPLAVHLAAKTPITPTSTIFPATQADIDYLAKKVAIEGLAIKVPSNRWPRSFVAVQAGQPAEGYAYVGDWDGTFRLERGCTNPAYILADLMERTGVDHDWVTHVKEVTFDAGGVRWGTSPLNWPMLYNFGRWCDELVEGPMLLGQSDGAGRWSPSRKTWQPRFTINTICHTREEMVQLRETLRMHCLQWQSTDPRYRTSYPGIPYPEVGA